MSMRLFPLGGLVPGDDDARTLSHGLLVEARQKRQQEVTNPSCVCSPAHIQECKVALLMRSFCDDTTKKQIVCPKNAEPLERELSELTKLEQMHGPNASILLEFCQRKATSARREQLDCGIRVCEHPVVSKARILLAKCILVLDSQVITEQLPNNDQDIENIINNHFTAMMQATNEKTQQTVSVGSKVSRYLVTSQGFLNLGLTDSVVDALVSDTAHRAHIRFFAACCNKNPALRQMIEKTTASKEAQALVDTSVDPDVLGSARPICAHLSAHLCLPTDSDFEKAIRIHRPEAMAQDILELLTHCTLSRTIDGKKVSFTLQARASEEAQNPLYTCWKDTVDTILQTPSKALFRVKVLASIQSIFLKSFPLVKPKDAEYCYMQRVLHNLHPKIEQFFDTEDLGALKKTVAETLYESLPRDPDDTHALCLSKMETAIQSTDYTLPWDSIYVEDLPELLGAYLEHLTETHRPKNALEFLELIVTKGKALQRQTKFITNASAGVSITLSSPHFAFALDTHHPSLKTILSHLDDAKSWSSGYQSSARSLVTDAPLALDKKKHIVQWMLKRYLCPKMAQNDQRKEADMKRVLNHAPTKCSLREFRYEMLKVLYEAANVKTDDEKQTIALNLDSFITKHVLPEDIQSHVDALVVYLAPIEKQHKGKTMHLCCYPDPLTGQIRLGVVGHDGSRLRPLDHRVWFRSEWLFCVNHL